jgi:hypothetical protein
MDGARMEGSGGVIVSWEWWCPGDTVGFGGVVVGDVRKSPGERARRGIYFLVAAAFAFLGAAFAFLGATFAFFAALGFATAFFLGAAFFLTTCCVEGLRRRV